MRNLSQSMMLLYTASFISQGGCGGRERYKRTYRGKRRGGYEMCEMRVEGHEIAEISSNI